MRALFSVIVLISLLNSSNADETLTLIETIQFPQFDSARVTSITPVGDFNADGYDDLLIGVHQNLRYEPERWFQGAYLYYGGPDFDTEADLVFYEDQYGQEESSGFGRNACRLNDFNGDGYDDIVISEPAKWFMVGRINIYFGSPEPDTIADLRIDGQYFHDFIGNKLAPGDFNGDGLGDLFTSANGSWLMARTLIYAGGNPPDTDFNFIYDSTFTDNILYGGMDINNDGYDEFAWDIPYSFQFLFFGGEHFSNEPDIKFNGYGIYYPGDVSNDGIDDFIREYDDEFYLCLGGNPLDTIPDYYMWNEHFFQCYPYVCPIYNGQNKLVVEIPLNKQIALYNTGVPFDTIPYAVFTYDVPGLYMPPSYIGDFNDDGISEFATISREDSIHNQVNLYSMVTTGIEEAQPVVPEMTGFLSCYPNPFNSSTVISYSSLEQGEIGIYDITGRLVKNYTVEAGNDEKIIWDGTDTGGDKVCSGIYFVRAIAENKIVVQKLTYIK